MADPARPEVTLSTLHDDLVTGFGDMRGGFADLKGEIRVGFADLKTTMVVGFRSLPTRESSEEMVRLLREANRLQEERFTGLDVTIREQHLEIQQVLRAVAEGQQRLVDGQRRLVEGQERLSEDQRALSADIKALIARIDALIRGRDNGNAPGMPPTS